MREAIEAAQGLTLTGDPDAEVRARDAGNGTAASNQPPYLRFVSYPKFPLTANRRITAAAHRAHGLGQRLCRLSQHTSNIGGVDRMSLLKETAIAVQFLALLLFVSHALLGPDESYRQLAIGPTSWLGAVYVPAERLLAKDPITGSMSGANEVGVAPKEASARDLTPEARIRSVFAQFVPDARRPPT